MTPMKRLSLILLIPFALLSTYAVWTVGYVGIFEYHLPSPAGWQVFADLVIGMLLILIWMYRDAQVKGRNFWGFALITLFLGSFGPLLYLLLAPDTSGQESGAQLAGSS